MTDEQAIYELKNDIDELKKLIEQLSVIIHTPSKNELENALKNFEPKIKGWVTCYECGCLEFYDDITSTR